ncbi:hypothetical protein K2173_025665 [Erythroxylum novogranatense]|uniref:PTM/DIR17-like Tudor domain-containing protein n=1 Tax=Erythroxylum novogranatense TaxID=1862640 RepID=A0AAV8SBB6_9ROSI|nr:hypothetical protein K2173_025665 [Erythroxylum novogranatense]
MASSSNVPFNGFGSLSAALSINKDEHDRRILDEAALEIGAIIMKNVNGVTIMGIVIDFDLEIDSYKVVYEDNQMEEIARRELHNYLAPPYLASDYLMELNESFNLARGQVSPADLARLEEAKAMMPPTPSPSLPTPPKKSSQPENNEPPVAKKPRAKRASVDPKTYVPLALRETKKDAYYWFFE